MPTISLRVCLLLVILGAMGSWFAADPASAVGMTYTVNIGSDGPAGVCDVAGCTLREAILAANANNGTDTIVFAPTVTTVSLTSQLPFADAKDGVTIDGGTGVTIHAQGGSVLFGLAFVTPLGTTARNVVVHNLNLSEFDYDGLQVCGGVNNMTLTCDSDINNVTVQGGSFTSNVHDGIRFFGKNISNVALTGVVANGNGEDGVEFQGSDVTSISIDDSTASGNDERGIRIDSEDLVSGVTIANSIASFNGYAGVDVMGDTAASVMLQDITTNDNDENGVAVDGTDLDRVTVSGATANNNRFYGIELSAQDTNTHSQVLDSTANGDEESAIVIWGPGGVADAVVENVSVNASHEYGLELYGAITSATISDSEFTNNVYPGIDASGSKVSGVNVFNSTISGSMAGIVFDSVSPPDAVNVLRENDVTGNVEDGVVVYGNAAVTISRNSTSGNGELGIDLSATQVNTTPGVTLNDVGDGDVGPNGLLNFPVLTGGGGQFVTGSACTGCLVELFLSDSDPSGYGEGQTFLSDTTVDENGNFAAPICGLGLAVGTKVTATATDAAGNTSEFSLNYTLPVASEPCPGTPTPPPTAAATATPTPTPIDQTPGPTQAPTPTPTGGAQLTQGDNDCDGDVDAVDALKGLQYVAAISFGQQEGCPQIGGTLPVGLPAGDSPDTFGDVDCDGDVDAVDALKILQFVAGLPFGQSEPCPDLGTPLP